ncbi:Hypothetical protein R9X50_00087600 [Acrodontium crateriforme]|uniref:Cytochrome b561 domain-containing protein n=1 Tax=Acrodontium crateriforme TaxID=150365 RepID=A0AAQ3M1E5_9PEZI|nr:Hypothetical protein R9X50_00087600 [Acrodontium crateriforme]
MGDDNFSPPGTSSYSSNTLHVGDGTWDISRDTFLLPNLVGMNFDTMRYNGMGNRFRGLPEYHRLIVGHGVLAAITFLGIVPLAIFFAKYGFFDRRRSMKIHVYLQILTVFLSTVILVLGWFAVGPERSLSNPHHGIGVAIYTLIMFQFLYGWLMARAERRRKNPMELTRTPLKVWLHKLLGRTVAILAFVQIPLGLTLYGSPKVLFILFGVWGALLIFAYLALDRYYFEKRPVEFGIHGRGRQGGPTEYYSDYGSYLSGTRTDFVQDERPPKKEHHWGRDILAVGGLLGAYEAFKHRKSAKREEREQAELDEERRHSQGPPRMSGARPPGSLLLSSGPYDQSTTGPGGPHRRPGSRPPGRQRPESGMSTESWEDEKFHQRSENHTWRNRLLTGAAGFAAFEGFKSFLNRRRGKDSDYNETGRYRPPLGGNQSFVSQTDVSRIQNGHAPFSPGTPGGRVGGAPIPPSPMTPSRPPQQRRPSVDSLSYADEESYAGRPMPPQHEESHTLRNSIATFGAIAGFKEWNKSRRERNERQRSDRIRRQELDNEDLYNRRISGNYPRPGDGGHGRSSIDETVMTGVTTEGPGYSGTNQNSSRYNVPPRPPTSGGPPPDTLHPPLPAGAGTISTSAVGSSMPPNTYDQGFSQHNQQSVNVTQQGYTLPPPPPGPPPGGMNQPLQYPQPDSGVLQMPSGSVNPDPSRLVSQGHPGRDAAAAGLAGAALGGMAARRRHSQSPARDNSQQDIRRRVQRQERRGSVTSSAGNTGSNLPGNESVNSPPISVKVKMHNDGRATLRRLPPDEAAAERAQRRQERRQRSRRGSSISSNGDASPGGAGGRYRRTGGPPPAMRSSSTQPITDIPPIPPSHSSSAGRRASELNLPPALPGGMLSSVSPSRPPPHGESPSGTHGLSPQGQPIVGSGLSGDVGSPGTGTDVSAFADNRRRRRAERARRLEAARGSNRVEFE